MTIAIPGERIVATDAHPFYVRQAHDFVIAGQLHAGEQLELSSGAWVTIASVQHQDQVLKVYNLSVSQLHTFFAGNNSVLVHNCGGRFGDLPSIQGMERHHLPADSVSGLSRNEGPAILMEKGDHQMTASWGNSASARAYSETQGGLVGQGRLDDAIQMDINDIQSKFGSKYDESILQMIDKL